MPSSKIIPENSASNVINKSQEKASNSKPTMMNLGVFNIAGFVLANGSMSTNTTGEGAIRQKMVENDLVDCMIALPGQLFYTTQIPVCLWFLTKNKKADSERGYRNREGETLFIDARKIGSMISRTQKELDVDKAELQSTGIAA